jgi:hypothetical protein
MRTGKTPLVIGAKKSRAYAMNRLRMGIAGQFQHQKKGRKGASLP